MRISLLPLVPEPIDVGVNGPEDRVVRRGEVAQHVAEYRLAVEILARVETPARYLHAAISICGNAGSWRLFRRWILPAGPDVNRVMRILIEETKRVVVETAASKITKRTQ